MGNCVEDRFESDEIARAAYALDRMSPSEIAKIISGDKREAVMRELAKQFSGEQILDSIKKYPSVRTVRELELVKGEFKNKTLVPEVNEIIFQDIQLITEEKSPLRTVLRTKDNRFFETSHNIYVLSYIFGRSALLTPPSHERERLENLGLYHPCLVPII